MSPIEHYLHRNRAGMTITAELLLDMSREGCESFRAIKAQAMELGIASQATLHDALHWLLAHKYLKATQDPTDFRKRSLAITARGNRYLSVLRDA